MAQARINPWAWLLVALLAAVVIIQFMPMAFAQSGPNPVLNPPMASANSIGICEGRQGMPVLEDWQVTGKVVECVRIILRDASFAMLSGLSDFLRPFANALLALYLLTFGVRWATSDKDYIRRSIPTLLKVIIVYLFTYNLGGWATVPFDVLDDLMKMVMGGFSPWTSIDLMLGNLFGFAPGFALFQGILGMLGGMLFASTTGAFVFVIGFIVILMVLGLVTRCVVTYMTAFLLLCFLILISPFILPSWYFRFGEQRYIRSWLHLVIATIMQQPLLFLAMFIFMSLMNALVTDVFDLFGGHDFRQFWRSSTPFFSWSLLTDPELVSRLENETGTLALPSMQTFLNPLMKQAASTSFFNAPIMDLGENGISITHQLIMRLFTLGATAYVMRLIIEKIPEISDEMAGARTGIVLSQLPFVNKISQMGSQIGNSFGGGAKQ